MYKRNEVVGKSVSPERINQPCNSAFGGSFRKFVLPVEKSMWTFCNISGVSLEDGDSVNASHLKRVFNNIKPGCQIARVEIQDEERRVNAIAVNVMSKIVPKIFKVAAEHAKTILTDDYYIDPHFSSPTIKKQLYLMAVKKFCLFLVHGLTFDRKNSDMYYALVSQDLPHISDIEPLYSEASWCTRIMNIPTDAIVESMASLLLDAADEGEGEDAEGEVAEGAEDAADVAEGATE